MRRQTGMLKESTRYDLPTRSPKHEQVENSRKIMKINDAIRSIMSIGNMEKMEFIAINNRNLFNYGKVKRAEWTNRKSCHQKTHFLPNLKSLKVDSTLHENISKRGGESKSVKKVESDTSYKMPEVEEALCEKYIEQYLKRLKQEKRFDILQNRNELILEACKQIHLKMEQSRVRNQKRSTKQLTSLCLTDEECEPVAKEFKGLRVNRKIKSITQASYNEEINRINRNSEYCNKQRLLNEKMFLRRIRGLKK